MATYRGKRDVHDNGGIGDTHVTVDDKPLPLRLEVYNHSPTGFEWGYGGSGPAQLALAILLDHFERKGFVGDGSRALDLHQDFKFHVVARWRDAEWAITTEQIDRALAIIATVYP